jgi:hypothetical protein
MTTISYLTRAQTFKHMYARLRHINPAWQDSSASIPLALWLAFKVAYIKRIRFRSITED